MAFKRARRLAFRFLSSSLLDIPIPPRYRTTPEGQFNVRGHRCSPVHGFTSKKRRWAASVHHHCSACFESAFPMSGSRILSATIVRVRSTACNHGPVLRGCMINAIHDLTSGVRSESLSPINRLRLYRSRTNCESVLDRGPIITVGTGTDKRNDQIQLAAVSNDSKVWADDPPLSCNF
jgi:hypothetical protein